MNGEFADYLRELEAMEAWPAGKLAQYQVDRLAHLVTHAYQHAPFYRERLAPLFRSGGAIDFSRWRDVPVASRSDIVDCAETLRVADLPKRYGPVAEFRTSGTTGTPLMIAANGMASMSANAALARLVRWLRLDPSQPLATIRIAHGDARAAYPEGKTRTSWIAGHPAPSYFLDVVTPVAQQLEWLSRMRPRYLLTYPSNAWALAESVPAAAGQKLGIEAVIANGETVTDEAREIVAERLGATLKSFYSCQEIGVIAIECPAGTQHHVAIENAFVELLDEQGHEVRPGERGRVVVTGLHNYAMPFVRYMLGDIAIGAERPCACGRKLPIIERIEGRVRNAFTFRDGTKIWPRGWLARAMRQFVPFRQYQFVQLDYETIELRYVPDESGRPADTDGLGAYARRMMHPSVAMTLKPMTELPRGPSGKFEDFFSLVTAASTHTSDRQV
jgi:phenylacetate-CoA ligase